MGLGEIVKEALRGNRQAERRGIHVCDRPDIEPSWGEGTKNTCDTCGRQMEVVNLGQDAGGEPQKAWRNL